MPTARDGRDRRDLDALEQRRPHTCGNGVLNLRSAVSPTPTTAPSGGVIPVSRRLLAVSVANMDVEVAVDPAVLVAVATTV